MYTIYSFYLQTFWSARIAATFIARVLSVETAKQVGLVALSTTVAELLAFRWGRARVLASRRNGQRTAEAARPLGATGDGYR